MRHAIVRAIVGLLLAWSSVAHAHKPSDSYLSLVVATDEQAVTGQWDIALRDLEYAIGIDGDGDGAITWSELRERRVDVERYVFAHLSIDSVAGETRSPCPLDARELLVDAHVDGAYAVVRFGANCVSTPRQIAVRYSLLFDIDPTHRGLLDLRTSGGNHTSVLSQAAPEFVVDVAAARSWTATVGAFVAEGLWHIFHGYDHILFLITLLLPAVVLFKNGRWEPRESLRDALVDVVQVVTAFTVAHSLTLSVATLGWVSLPSRLVESAIAFTVALGALNNLYPVVTRRRWLVAFVFGLIHGFGFASVLADLGLQRADLALALFGFNVGVELGQLTIVVVLVPVAFSIRNGVFYRRVFMPAGAVIIAVLALFWFIERAGIGPAFAS